MLYKSQGSETFIILMCLIKNSECHFDYLEKEVQDIVEYILLFGLEKHMVDFHKYEIGLDLGFWLRVYLHLHVSNQGLQVDFFLSRSTFFFFDLMCRLLMAMMANDEQRWLARCSDILFVILLQNHVCRKIYLTLKWKSYFSLWW